jgi:1-acyl-sn-glycerol-3-phosphate acyltransferase
MGSCRSLYRPAALVYRLLQLTVGPLVRLLWRLRVVGGERLPAGPVVLAANHESVLDPLVVGAAFERPLRFLAKEELWRSRLLGRLLDACGAIRVARGRGDREAVAAGVRALEARDVVAVFPQGTALPHRSRPWLRGAARLALTTGAPVLPVAIVNSERAIRPHRLKIGFPRIIVLVGEPIEVTRGKATVVAARELTERVEEAVEALRAPYPPPAHAWLD